MTPSSFPRSGASNEPRAVHFTAAAPNQLWLTDLTEHRTDEGKLYVCAIKDVFSNRIVGYSIGEVPEPGCTLVSNIRAADCRLDELAQEAVLVTLHHQISEQRESTLYVSSSGQSVAGEWAGAQDRRALDDMNVG